MIKNDKWGLKDNSTFQTSDSDFSDLLNELFHMAEFKKKLNEKKMSPFILNSHILHYLYIAHFLNSVNRSFLIEFYDIWVTIKFLPRDLTDTGQNVQKWTRVFSTRRWVILFARTRRKNRRKYRVQFWTFSPVDKFRVLACIG